MLTLNDFTEHTPRIVALLRSLVEIDNLPRRAALLSGLLSEW